MNMHATVGLEPTRKEVIHSVGELLTVALNLLDELDVPAEIGAHLDLTIQKLAGIGKEPAGAVSLPASD